MSREVARGFAAVCGDRSRSCRWPRSGPSSHLSQPRIPVDGRPPGRGHHGRRSDGRSAMGIPGEAPRNDLRHHRSTGPRLPRHRLVAAVAGSAAGPPRDALVVRADPDPARDVDCERYSGRTDLVFDGERHYYFTGRGHDPRLGAGRISRTARCGAKRIELLEVAVSRRADGIELENSRTRETENSRQALASQRHVRSRCSRRSIREFYPRSLMIGGVSGLLRRVVERRRHHRRARAAASRFDGHLDFQTAALGIVRSRRSSPARSAASTSATMPSTSPCRPAGRRCRRARPRATQSRAPAASARPA